jgi:hypothetical protein
MIVMKMNGFQSISTKNEELKKNIAEVQKEG